MKELSQQVFDSQRLESGVWNGGSLSHCLFDNCVALGATVETRPTISNTVLVNCSHRGCLVEGPILDQVLVQGLRGPLLQLWGTAFVEVTLKGEIERLMISSAIDLLDEDSPRQTEFDVANRELMHSAKFSLDITDAQFKEVTIRGIPVRTVRRNPATQLVVERDSLRPDWRNVAQETEHWVGIIHRMLESGDASALLVVPELSPNARQYSDDLRRLRDAGIAS